MNSAKNEFLSDIGAHNDNFDHNYKQFHAKSQLH